MSLGPTSAFFSHYFSLLLRYCIPPYLISCALHLSFFILSTCFVSYPLHPEWWASSVHHMEDSHIISTIYLTDIGLEILSLRRSSCQREFVGYLCTWGCVHLLLISSLGFICSRSGYAYLYICKKKKKKLLLLLLLAHVCMCIVFTIIGYVYWCLGGHFYRVCSLLGVRMWALWDPMLFVLLRHIYLWERWVTFS